MRGWRNAVKKKTRSWNAEKAHPIFYSEVVVDGGGCGVVHAHIHSSFDRSSVPHLSIYGSTPSIIPAEEDQKGNVWASNNLHENQWLMAAMKLSAINWEMETFKKTDKLSICWQRSRMSGWRYEEFHLLVPHGMSINIEAIHFVVITCSGNLVCTSSPFLLLSLVPWI